MDNTRGSDCIRCVQSARQTLLKARAFVFKQPLCTGTAPQATQTPLQLKGIKQEVDCWTRSVSHDQRSNTSVLLVEASIASIICDEALALTVLPLDTLSARHIGMMIFQLPTRHHFMESTEMF